MNIKLKYSIIIFLSLLVLTFSSVNPVSAQSEIDSSRVWKESLNKVIQSTEYDENIGENGNRENGLIIIIAQVIKDILSILGIIFVILAVYAGYLWMMAGGNDDQVAKAKNIIKNVIVGLIIILSAYATAYYVLENLIKATTSEQGHRTGVYLND